jgi:hypothetical protein
MDISEDTYSNDLDDAEYEFGFSITSDSKEIDQNHEQVEDYDECSTIRRLVVYSATTSSSKI